MTPIRTTFAVALTVSAFLSTSVKGSTQELSPRLTVTVTDQSGGIVPVAVVSLSSGAPGQLFTGKTDGNGSANFNLAVGHYALAVSPIGFADSRTDLELSKADDVTIALDVCNGGCGGWVQPDESRGPMHPSLL